MDGIELVAQGCLEPVAFVAEFFDFLPGGFEFGAQAEWAGGLAGADGVLWAWRS
ncbi:hypothetical protein [Streptomyces sp. NPDC007205]|uniref:hypothetical protein n=1 Tax=Streptomyces sp. NPDC007205 TaxID=3154316 RepID=UPI0033E1FB92